MLRVLLILLSLVGCNFDGAPAEAALAKFYITGDLCSGAGTKANPMLCAVLTDGTVDGDGSTGDPLSIGTVIGGMNFGLFGDGYQGNCSITVNTIMNTDAFCEDLTIDAGVYLYTAGYRVFVRGTLYLNGAIGFWGQLGGNGLNGTAAVAACTLASGGSFANTVMLAGTTGGNGNATPTAGAAAGSSLGATDATGLGGAAATGTGSNGTSASTLFRGGGGASAGGFVGTPSTIGGSSGATTTLVAGRSNEHGDILNVLRARSLGTQSLGQWTPGSGGGGGSCGKATVQPTHKVPGGGGGGQGGGFVVIAARQIVIGVSGGIYAYGGDGGAGGSCGTHDGNATGGGGGGGGGGGAIFVIYGTGTAPTTGQMLIYGGNGGAGGTGCVGGTNGGMGGGGGDGIARLWKAGL